MKEMDKMANNKNSNTNELLVYGAQQAIDQ